MRNLVLGLACMMVGASVSAASLATLQWRYRPIIVFAPDAARAAAIRHTLATSPGVADRDIAWFVVDGGEIATNIDLSIDREALDEDHDTAGFEAILVGKDGGVKARQTQTFDLPAFFKAIDAMPMRKREMRQSS